MKIKSDDCKYGNRNGSALLSVVIISTIIFIVTGGLCAFSLGTAQQVRHMTDTIRAKAIAEAGANEAYSRLSIPENYNSLRTNAAAFPTTEFGGGSYQIILEPESGGRTRVISIGRFGVAEQRVGMNLWDANVPPRYFDYSIFANGDMNFNGTPKQIEGDLHTNGIWILNGNETNINGYISAQNNVDSVPESHRPPWGWEEIRFPQLTDLEFQEFLAAVEAAGELTQYSGDQTRNGSSGGLTVNGVTVITGNLTFNGGADLNVDGLLYVTGNILSNGSGDININGVILAGGSVRLNGASTTFQHDYINSRYLDMSSPHVLVSTWWD